MSEKRPYIVTYDSGHGGVWLVIDARSPQEINAKYPPLLVHEKRPDSMDDDDEKRYCSNCEKAGMHFDIDAESSGWLKELAEKLAKQDADPEGNRAGVLGLLLAFVYPYLGILLISPACLSFAKDAGDWIHWLGALVSLSSAVIVIKVMRPGGDYCLMGVPLIIGGLAWTGMFTVKIVQSLLS
jgi:hypothetical protein